MRAAVRALTRQRRLGLVLLALSIAGLVWVISQNRSAVETLGNVTLSTLGLMVVLHLVSMAAMSWRHLVALRASQSAQVGAWAWYRILILGRFFNLVAPQLGMVYRAVALNRDHGVAYTSFAAAVALFLWISTVLNLVLGALVVGLTDPGLEFGPVPLWIVLAATAAAAVVLVPAVMHMTRLNPERTGMIRSRLRTVLSISRDAVRRPMFVLEFVISWLVGLAASAWLYAVAFDSVGLHISLGLAIALYGIIQILTIVAITPGNLGVQELGLVGVASVFGLDASGAAVAAVLFRSVGIVVLIVQAILFGAFRIAGVLRGKTPPKRS